MKLVAFAYRDEEHIGVLTEDGSQVQPLPDFADMQELIENVAMEDIADYLDDQALAISEVELMAPVPYPDQDIICLGINFLDHARESARFVGREFKGQREYPVYFGKRVAKASADGDPIPWYGELDDHLDYEAELAVVIGKFAQSVSAEQAMEHVFGYTVINDVTARTLQKRHMQFYRGKSLDGFCPMGPCLVTADELPDLSGLGIRSYVNGELRQNAKLGDLIFDIPYVISELSMGIALYPGAIISMGTPSGVGMGFDPPRFLKPGDEVACEIDGIGRISNKVVDHRSIKAEIQTDI